MDHWGDPWSDNARETPAAKTEVTPSQPPVQFTTPVLLNGFLDDAGWGTEDASFGDWAMAPENELSGVATVYTPTDSDERHKDRLAGLDADTVRSEVSDSATTVQQDESVQAAGTNSPSQLPLDDGSSARPSTSLSDRSNVLPTESPRTSVDEERGGIKSATFEANPQEIGEDTEATFSEDKTGADVICDASCENLMSDHLGVQSSNFTPSPEKSQGDAAPVPSTHADDLVTAALFPGKNAFSIDLAILDELFPPIPEVNTLEEAPQDPIYSTTGRKAWYRLTRKQTMREFNSGNAGDDYIRVTWANSEIRKTANNTIGRWAREDRLSGTGSGARASFYWDTAAPAETAIPKGHSRTKTAVPTSRVVVPARQSLPPLCAETPVTFNWSSAAATNHWSLGDTRPLSISPSLTVGFTATSVNRGQDIQAISMDVAPPNPGKPKEVTEPHHENPDVTSLIATPVTPSISSFPEESTLSSSNNANVLTKDNIAGEIVDDDDDDEWGEMVGSTPSAPLDTGRTVSRTSSPNTFSTGPTVPATPPKRSLSAQKHSNDTMHASHITRLQGTISPTSAILGPRSFIPLGVEKGPIGPAMLRPVQKSSMPKLPERSPSLLPTAIVVPKIYNEPVQEANHAREATSGKLPPRVPAFAVRQGDDKSSPLASSPSALPFATPPGAVVGQQSNLDPWADADLSFLDPAQLDPVVSRQRTLDSSAMPDTCHVSIKSARAAPSTPYTSSLSPQASSPPPKPSATNPTTQHHANETDTTTIQSILRQLPNLTYMLQ